LIALAGAGSAALLAGAFLLQAWGWAPCAMCLWQRWPHAAAVVIGAVALLISSGAIRQALAALGTLALLITAGLAAYHSGVERGWWEGPASCTSSGNGLGDLSGADLIPGGSDGPALVLCDTLQPFLFGLTLANWNLLASLALAALWLGALGGTARRRI
jgi:disulfide bond formation protein DsbB